MDNYKKFIKKALEYRAEGKMKHRDITILNAIMLKLNFEEYRDIKNKRIVASTEMNKSDISKSITTLRNLHLIEENNEGYKLNIPIDDEEEI